MLNSRIRKRVDPSRLGQSVGYPGIDPRTWVSTARVDDHPDAISWHGDVGWLVDVTFTGGDLDGEGPVPCRVASMFAADLEGSSEPVTRGCEVLVLMPVGDPNSSPIVVAQLHNGGGCRAPATVNDQPVDEAFALGNHLVKSEKGNQEQYAGDWQVRTGPTASLEAEQTLNLRAGTAGNLGGTEASPPIDAVLKGTAYVNSLATFQSQLQTFVTQVQTFGTAMAAAAGSPPLTPLVAPATALAAAAGAFLPAISALTTQAQAALSLKFKVE